MGKLIEIPTHMGEQLHINILQEIVPLQKDIFTERFDVEDLINASQFIKRGLEYSLLSRLKSAFEDNQYVIIRGIGLNFLNLENVTFSKVINNLLIGVTQYLGYNPYGFKQEKNGAIIHEIIPISGKEDKVSSEGNVEFGMHADGAYLERELRPQTLSLICLDNSAKTSTKLVKADDIIERLTFEEIDILSQNRFLHTPPDTFKVKAESNPKPVLENFQGNQELRIATHSCTAIDLEADNALNKLKDLADTLSFEHDWKEGDLIIFNNLRTLHGRGEILGKRHLRRCYASSYHNCFDVLDLSL